MEYDGYNIQVDDRNNPPSTKDKKELNIIIQSPNGYFQEITLDERLRVVKIGANPVLTLLYGE